MLLTEAGGAALTRMQNGPLAVDHGALNWPALYFTVLKKKFR